MLVLVGSRPFVTVRIRWPERWARCERCGDRVHAPELVAGIG